MVNSSAMTAAHREKTDLLLQPPLAQIDMLNWSAFDRAIAAGYEYAVRRLEALPADSLLRQGTDEPAPRRSESSPAISDLPSFVPAES
jgi:predicted acylesterase/phospholipase RssA